MNDKSGEFLWSKQREICKAVVQHRKVAVKAGHGVGKSMNASRLAAWWWVNTHPPEQTWLVTTAPTRSDHARARWCHYTARGASPQVRLWY